MSLCSCGVRVRIRVRVRDYAAAELRVRDEARIGELCSYEVKG